MSSVVSFPSMTDGHCALSMRAVVAAGWQTFAGLSGGRADVLSRTDMGLAGDGGVLFEWVGDAVQDPAVAGLILEGAPQLYFEIEVEP
jgi:ornithine cyclodeaminase/alanine dehydrogenase-like protein (mu-crystallin family)